MSVFQLKSAYYHRWVVFLLDLCLCAISVVLSTVLFHYHESLDFILNRINLHAAVILPSTVVFHLLIRPHMGIIRQTALYDLVKLLVVRFLVLLLSVIWVYELHNQGKTDYLYSILVMDFLLSALLLISLRLVVKWLFAIFNQNATPQSSVLIYGVGASGNLTYNALQAKYKVLAFVDDDRSKQGKRFQGKRILSLEQAKKEFIEPGKASLMVWPSMDWA
ncbi:MAG: hypothetical protein FJX91_08000 [Bacteroidetes bacterium]|nr:hypothetical protein [Bacteroidota bacterium]